ncbi:MAG: radical SAM protein [Planctomycetes bacterium]|nr:radical SAM protein [Planctomycetota bacterium]
MTWSEILEQADAEASARNDARYGQVPCRRVLNPTRGPAGSFLHSINPYLNCELGCAFCFAREFSRRREGERLDGEDRFARRIHAKRGAAEVLRSELERLAAAGKLGEPIALGTATDPYQPLERRQQLTRQLLGVLLEAARAHPGALRLIVATRSDLVLRDVDLLRQLREVGQLRVTLGLPSVDRDLLRSLEPRAPTPALRLRAVEGLRRAGLEVGVSCSPILPGLGEDPRALRRVVCAAQQAGARYLQAEVLSLRGASRQAFMAWVEAQHPSYAGLFAQLYRGPLPPWTVRDRIERVVHVLRCQYGLPERLPWAEREGAPRRLPTATPWSGAGPLFEGGRSVG